MRRFIFSTENIYTFVHFDSTPTVNDMVNYFRNNKIQINDYNNACFQYPFIGPFPMTDTTNRLYYKNG
jgi:hypothetical protein